MINLFKNKDLSWKRFQGGNDFDYPIDYSAALLNANQDGHVDILYRWEPDCYCHFHRHTAEVSSVVLEGELHVIDINDGGYLMLDSMIIKNEAIKWINQQDKVDDRFQFTIGGAF